MATGMATGMAAVARGARAEVAGVRYRVYCAVNKARIVTIVRETGCVAEAVRQIGGSESGVSKALQSDPDFKAAVAAARAEYLERRAAGAPGYALPARADAAPPVPAEPQPFDASAEAQAAFLERLAELGGVRTAASTLGLKVDSLFAARDADPAFAARWRRALRNFIEVVESELMHRSIQFIGTPGAEARAVESRVVLQLAAKMRAELDAALAEEPPAVAADSFTRIEAQRLELEARLASLIERHGDPFAAAAE